jgi:glycosyltransferase involved in cell wall biosynthesis
MTPLPGGLRVLQVITHSFAGAADHVLNLTAGLQARGHDCTLAFTPGGPLDAAFAATGARIVPLRMRRSVHLPFLAADTLTLYRLIRRERFDVVHTHLSFPGIAGRIAARAAGARCVLHMFHTITAHDYARPATRRLLLAVERALGRITHHSIAGSDAIREKLIDLRIVPADRITTIHYGVDFRRFAALPDRAGMRHELGLGLDAPVVMTACRLEPQKGIGYLQEAFRRVCAQIPGAILLVAGTGPLEEPMRAFAARHGLTANFRFLGWRDDVPRLMAAVDVLALASLWEAFGLVFAEAGLAHLPVAATRVEGIPEVVHDGETGLLVPPADADALAGAILRLLRDRDLAARLAAAAHAHIRANFGTERMVEGHVELYRSLSTTPSPHFHG